MDQLVAELRVAVGGADLLYIWKACNAIRSHAGMRDTNRSDITKVLKNLRMAVKGGVLERIRTECRNVVTIMGSQGSLGPGASSETHRQTDRRQTATPYVFSDMTIAPSDTTGEETDLAASVQEPFFLHMFLDKYISDELGNDVKKVLRNFLAMMKKANKSSIMPAVQLGLDLLENEIISFHKKSFWGTRYEEWAKAILSLNKAIVLPSGYSSSEGGHMVTVYFCPSTDPPSPPSWTVTYANSGKGIDLIWDDSKGGRGQYHDKSGSVYQIINTYRINADITAKCLAALLQNMAPQKGPPEFPANRNMVDFYSGAFLKSGVVTNGAVVDNPYTPDTSSPVVHADWAGVFEHHIEVGQTGNGGSRDRRGRLYMAPQISGTCTFHSMMWILFYLYEGHVKNARLMELGLREATLDNLSHNGDLCMINKWTGEETSIIRLMVQVYLCREPSSPFKDHPTLKRLQDVLIRSAVRMPITDDKYEQLTFDTILRSKSSEKINKSLKPLNTAAEVAKTIVGAQEWYIDLPGDLLNMARNLTMGLGGVLKGAPSSVYEADPCGTTYVSAVVDFARALAIGCLEHVCVLGESWVAKDNRAEVKDEVKDGIHSLADTALHLFSLFEGSMEAATHANNYKKPASAYEHGFLNRFRTVVPRLLILAIDLNEKLPDGHAYRIVPPGIESELKTIYNNSRAFQFVRSRRAAAKILPYIPYAFIEYPIKVSSYPYWKVEGVDPVTHKRKLIQNSKHLTMYDYPLNSFLESLVHSTKMAIATLVTLLYVDSDVYIPLAFSSDTFYPTIYYYPNEAYKFFYGDLSASDKDNPRPFNIHTLIRTDSAELRTHRNTAMDDIVRISRGQSIDSVVHNDVHLDSSVRLSTLRSSFGYNVKTIVDNHRQTNYSLMGAIDWMAYQRSVFLPDTANATSLVSQIPTMTERGLVFMATRWWDLNRPRSLHPISHPLITALDERGLICRDTSDATIRVACAIAVWALGGPVAAERQSLLWTYLKQHRASLARYGESPMIWPFSCSAHKAADSSTSLCSFLLCKLVLEWAAGDPGWIHHVMDIIPPLQRVETASSKVHWLLKPTYDLPPWFQLPLPTNSHSTSVIPGVVTMGGIEYEVKVRVRDSPSSLGLERRTQDSGAVHLVFAVDPSDDLGILVSRLNTGGFGCTVWTDGSRTLTVVEFSDRLEAVRRGEVRCHTNRAWELVWEGHTWDLVHEDELPAAVREWGRGYKMGVAAFWVRDQGTERGRTFFPQLLMATGHHMELSSRDTTFNEVSKLDYKIKIPMPVRTMIFTMQACGLVPALTADPEETLLLFALCDFSAKDRCVARMFWSVRGLIISLQEGGTLSQLALYVKDNYCMSPGTLGHPHRLILRVTYPWELAVSDKGDGPGLKERGWSPALFVPPTAGPPEKDSALPAVQDARLVSERLFHDLKTGEWKLVSPPLAGDEVVEEQRVMSTLQEEWAHIHQRSYLDSLCTSLGPDHHRVVWNARVLEAHWATRHITDDARAVAMMASRVHPAIVRPISEKRSLLEWQFEAARGMFLNKAQIDELDRVWPNFTDPTSLPPPARIFQAVMGMGKSAVLIPFLVFRSLQAASIKHVVLVQPDHLVRDARATLHNFFAVLGGFYGPLHGDRVRLLGKLKAGVVLEGSEKIVSVVSDIHLKEYFLTTLREVSPDGVLQYKTTMVIYDEIDSMYTPMRSEFNVPDPHSKCFHPCQTLPEPNATPSSRWETAYGQFVVDVVDQDGKVATEDGILHKKLCAKIVKDVDQLRHQSLNYHFGHANDERVLLAVPYKAVRTPMDSSAFSDIDITAILTYRTKRDEGLLARDFRLLKRYLTEWRRALPIGPDDLDAIFRGVAGTSAPTIGVLTGSTDAGLVKKYGRDQGLIRYYVVNVLFPRHLSFYRRRSNLSFVDMMDISQYKLGFSGTVSMTVPRFPGAYSVPTKANMATNVFHSEIARSESTEAEIRRAICGEDRGPTDGHRPPHILDSSTIEMALQSHPALNVIIDAAALWKDEGTDSVVAKVLPILLGRSAKSGCTWSFVYIDDQDRPRERVVLPSQSSSGQRQSDTLYRQPNTSRQTLYYFDQRHSRGTDLVLPNDARAVVTVDSRLSAMSDIAQAAFRLRWINRGQSAHYLVLGNTNKRISTGIELYGHLQRREDRANLQQLARHHVQNYKAVMRWYLLRRVSAPLTEEEYGRIFTETNPYELSPRGDVVYNGDAGADELKFMAELKAAAAPMVTGQDGTRVDLDPGTEQNVNVEAEVDDETEQAKDTSAWGRNGNCLATFNNMVQRIEWRYIFIDDYGTPSSYRGDVTIALDALRFTLSPLLLPPDAESDKETSHDIPPRFFRTNSGGVFTILAVQDYLATPESTSSWWRECVYDRYGNMVGSVRQSPNSHQTPPPDHKFLLGRLLCGARLNLCEQIVLLRGYMTTLPDDLGYLRTLLACLRRNNFFRTTQGHLLDTFIGSTKIPINADYIGQLISGIPTDTIDKFIKYLLRNFGPGVEHSNLANNTGIVTLYENVQRTKLSPSI